MLGVVVGDFMISYSVYRWVCATDQLVCLICLPNILFKTQIEV